MTPDFLKAVDLIFKHEGGLVDHPADPGGLTKYGISQRAYPDVDIRNLTKPGAASIYYRDYWLKVKGDSLPYGVALQIFDMAVNAGVRRAVRMAQSVSGAKIDGIMGPKTLDAILAKPRHYFVDEYKDARLDYYRRLDGYKHFGKGWERRINDTFKVAKNALQ